MTPERAGANPEWRTPKKLFELLDRLYGFFNLDAAATADNALCTKFYTKEDSGLLQPWHGRVFCNPPYGREIGQWVYKAAQETVFTDNAERAVLLLPARTDTKWFHAFVAGYASEILLMQGRVPFEGFEGSSPLFPSMVAVYGGPGVPTAIRAWDWQKELV